jgi:type II secretory pathway pseudopilin PulG
MAAEKRERQQAKAAKSAATTTTTARTTSLRVQPIHNADECWSPCHQALTAGANRATVEASGKQHKPNPPTARNWCPDRDSCTASINGDHR